MDAVRKLRRRDAVEHDLAYAHAPVVAELWAARLGADYLRQQKQLVKIQLRLSGKLDVDLLVAAYRGGAPRLDVADLRRVQHDGEVVHLRVVIRVSGRTEGEHERQCQQC